MLEPRRKEIPMTGRLTMPSLRTGVQQEGEAPVDEARLAAIVLGGSTSAGLPRQAGNKSEFSE
jgi:hypothetical protein